MDRIYEPDFLSIEEADLLFNFAKTLPRLRPMTKISGFKKPLRRLQMPCFSVFSESNPPNTVPFSKSPQIVHDIADRLSVLANKAVNYLSFVGYENEKDHIGWHQHREDKCRDAQVFIISLGDVRTFGLRKLCDNCRVCDACNKQICEGAESPICLVCRSVHKHRKSCAICRNKREWTILRPEHGSLIVLPNAYNNSHEHAVLDDVQPKGLRISINTKHL